MNDIHVPVGIASLTGSHVVEMDTIEGYRRPYVTVMKWVEGEHVKGEITGAMVTRMGELMGKLHEAVSGFHLPSNFVRPVWGADAFRSELVKLERYYNRFLSDQAWTEYQHAVEKILSRIADMEKNEQNYGMIHADLHADNIVFKDGIPYPIDFGRCGFGYFLYDLAGSLIGLYPRERMTFIQGYENVRKLETDYLRDLECFFIMFMIENYCHHASNPEETSNLVDEQPYAQALIREFLKGNPFLFVPVEPVDVGKVQQ
ncbi:phosphotransferase [Paenibacillus illinoisensis]